MLFEALLIAAAQLQPADTGAPGKADMIVTGERVKRTVKETASSVSVATRRDVVAASANQVEQMLALVPNVQLGNGSQGPTIRGQDTTGALHDLPAFLGGNRPRTTLVIDGRRSTYFEFVFGSAPVWDVQRMEVFRTPQSTTQGQNSIAGAIFVTSNPPTFTPEAQARVIAGNLHTRQLSAAVSGPISGDIAIRASGDLRYSRTTSRIVDHIVGAEPNHDVYGLGRVQILAKPRRLPGSQLLVTYVHVRSQAPQVQAITPPYRERRDTQGGYGVFRTNVDSVTANAHGAIDSDLSIDVIASTGDSKAIRLAAQGAGQARILGRDWSTESVLHWTPSTAVRVTAGASRSHVGLRQVIDLSILSGIGRFRDSQDGTGLFGQADLTVGKASLAAGLRYQQDRQDRTGALDSRRGPIPLDYDRTFHAWLPKLSLAWDFTPAIRIGALVQRAYNPGGTTLRFDTGPAEEFRAERLWDYELFARAQFGQTLSASANLFRYDIRDVQRDSRIQVLAPNGFPVTFADLFNVPRARSAGGEFELDWHPGKRVSARASLGLLATKITDAGPDKPALRGKQFDRSPHLSVSAAVDWHATDQLRLSAQVRHHSRYFSDNENLAALQIEPATIVDARAEYRLGRVTAFGYMRNLFDSFALVEKTAFSAYAEDPREFGLGLSASF